jgi:hypothetical protein
VLRGLIVASLVAAGLASAAPQAGRRWSSATPSAGADRRVRARRPLGARRVVVGVIHGTEPAGLRGDRALRRMPLPPGVHLWLVPTVNPDGLAAGSAPERARRRPEPQLADRLGAQRRALDGYYSGPRPLSEPENRAMRAFLLQFSRS